MPGVRALLCKSGLGLKLQGRIRNALISPVLSFDQVFGCTVLEQASRFETDGACVGMSYKGLMATTLRYPYEIRAAEEYFDDIPDVKVEPDMLKLAEHILQSKATDFDPSQFVDHYEEAVVAMLKKKQAGLPVSREGAAPRPQNVANLMDALRRSIAEEKASSTPPKKGRKRIEGQGEMLLPIAGKAKKVATAKPAERPSAREKNVG